jgi:hypothetical protein
MSTINAWDCLQYTVTTSLFVNYTKITGPLKGKPITDKKTRIEWDGEVELKLTLQKKNLTELSGFVCYTASKDPSDPTCPRLCETPLLLDEFTGVRCGSTVNSVAEFLAGGKCAPGEKCDPTPPYPYIPPRCIGLYSLKCKKVWNTCGQDPDIEKYFDGGDSKSINLGSLGGKSAATLAWSVLITVAQWQAKCKAASLGGKASQCCMCNLLCCLATGMVDGFSAAGFGAGCNMEDCAADPGFGTTPQECRDRCAKKWAKFLLDSPCDPRKVDSDNIPSIFKQELGSSIYKCPGCCKE